MEGNTIFTDLEESYTARCGDRLLALKAWKSFADAHPPVIPSAPGPSPLPSQSLALEAGDFGLAILWIVQATIVRAFANNVVRDTESAYPAPASLAGSAIGALAHSEDRADPLIIRESGNDIIISGKKKYITGGLDSDFILLTARREGDDSVTSLIYLPGELLPGGALKNLSLGILKTVSHASLNLRDFRIPGEYLISISPGALRKQLKIWGIVERVLIMEAFIALMLYLVRRMINLSITDSDASGSLEHYLAAQEGASREALTAALSGERIIAGGADAESILEEYAIIGKTIRSHQEKNDIPETLLHRYNDLGLIAGMKS